MLYSSCALLGVPPQICIESKCIFNLFCMFYLKVCLRCTESFRKKSDHACTHILMCAKKLLDQKVLYVGKAHLLPDAV